MFSGIVETLGIVTSIEIKEGCKYFLIMPNEKFTDLSIGESIAVNGVCLTVTHFTRDSFAITAVPETLRLTNLNFLTVNAKVNLERSLKLSSRLGGHYVQGHVDTMGKILAIENQGAALLVKISINEKYANYVVPKGYIGLDGMSITVIEANPTWFSVTFIPHTQQITVVNHYQVGTEINIEVDIMGKYVEKLLGAYTHASHY